MGPPILAWTQLSPAPPHKNHVSHFGPRSCVSKDIDSNTYVQYSLYQDKCPSSYYFYIAILDTEVRWMDEIMHGSQEFMANNHLTQRVEPKDKSGLAIVNHKTYAVYLALCYSLIRAISTIAYSLIIQRTIG